MVIYKVILLLLVKKNDFIRDFFRFSLEDGADQAIFIVYLWVS